MNPLQLRETMMAVETRQLIQLTLDDFEETDKINGYEDKGNLAEI